MSRVDGNMKVCILKVYHYEPISLREKRDEGFERNHSETSGSDVFVEVSEIVQGTECIRDGILHPFSVL